MGNSLFEYYKGSLEELVKMGKKAGNILYKMILLPTVSNRLKSDLLNNGIALDGQYRHTIDNFAIKHVCNEHASEKENLRGQVPISDELFYLSKEVIEEYDEIRVEKNSRNQMVIIYCKWYEDGNVYYIEEIRGKRRKELAFVSMRKEKKKKSGFPNEAARASTLGSSANSTPPVGEKKYRGKDNTKHDIDNCYQLIFFKSIVKNKKEYYEKFSMEQGRATVLLGFDSECDSAQDFEFQTLVA